MFNKKNTSILPLKIFLCLVLYFILVHLPAFGQKKTPEWSKNAVMYELNVRQFSEEGTFNAIISHLPRLKTMGIDIIWLMPIHPIGVKNRKGSLGSYYAVKNYKEVNPEFGSMDDFKKLVKSVHDLDMKIIIDWVANHSSPDNIWVDEGHKDWYTLDSAGNLQPTIGTDWWDVADLNYDSKEMRNAMIDAMKFWVSETNIDGYRCDVAGWVPIDFWNDVRRELDKIKPVFMLAEDEGEKLHKDAFDVTYAWELHHVMNKIAKGTMNADSVIAYFEREKKRFPIDAYRLNFTSNHDENSWNGTEFERLGDGVEAFAVFAATIYGMPLIYNGQESSFNRRLKFFEKDKIDWNNYNKNKFYTSLFNFKKQNPAIWNGAFGGFPSFIKTSNPNVLVYERNHESNSVLVILNLSPKKQTFLVDLSALSDNYKKYISGSKVKIKKGMTRVKMKSWEYQILYR
ncbi:MAG: alpha-amylase [Bacteroidetes bacterium]|nr:alpha-amylase [Bacteroidota bacterium]